MKFRFLDHRDGGGTGSGSAGAGSGGGADDGSAGAGAGGGGTTGGSAGAGDSGGSGGGAAGAGNDLPNFQNLDEATAAYRKLHQEHGERSAAYKKLEGDHKNLAKKVGEQGNLVKQFQQIEEALNGDPKRLLSELAKSSGVKIRFDDGDRGGAAEGGPNMEEIKELLDTDPVKAHKLLDAHIAKQQDAELDARVDKRLTPALERMLETEMRQKYPDWSEHETKRKLLNARVAIGEVPFREVLHLALKGNGLQDAHKQGFDEGYEKAKADIAAKMAGEHSDGGSTGGDRGGKTIRSDNRVVLGNVLAAMHNQRPWTGVQS